MTLSLLVNGVDYTSRWRPYESRWTLRGHMLESMQSEFVLDDEDGDLPIGDVRPRKIVEVWEDASGSPVCLYRGRIAAKTLGRGPLRTNPAMRWRLMVEDVNVEVRGIRIVSFNRDAELDTTRVEVLRLAYLNGAASLNPHARDSTTLGGTYIQSDSTTTLDPDHYTDTYPDQLLLQVAEDAGKQVFVYLEDDGTMELFYGTFGDSLALTSDIELNDDGSADGEDVFAPYYSEATAEHDGQRVITGGGLRYGPDDDYFGESDVNGTEATYDKWEEHLVNEYIDNETEADRHVTNVVHVRQAEQSYTAVIDMRPEQVHRIKAGMVVNHQQLSAAKTLGLQRASQVTYEPKFPDKDGNTAYRVTIELGRPRSRRSILNTRRRPTAKPIPRRPTEGTAEACTRLYFTADAATIVTDDAAWEYDSGGGLDTFELNGTPQSSVDGGIGFTGVNVAVGEAHLRQFRIALTGDLLAAIQSGGTFRMQARANARSGIGIDEGAQNHRLTIGMRVQSGGSIIATPVAVGSVLGTANLPAQASPYINRSLVGSFSAVPSAATSDVLIIETGVLHTGPTSGGTGAGIWFNDSAASDLPEDDVETSNLRSWIDLCTSSAGGDTTSPTVLPGEETPGSGVGEDDEPTYVGPDHTHSHGLLADDGVHMHDADQIDGLPEADDSTDDTAVLGLHGQFIAAYHRASDTLPLLMASEDGIVWRDFGSALLGATTMRDPSLIHWDGSYWLCGTIGAAGATTIYTSDDLETWTSVVTLTSIGGGNRAWAPEWIRNMDGTPYLHPDTGFPTVTINISTDAGSTFTVREMHPTNRGMTSWSSTTTITGTGFPSSMIDGFLLADTDAFYLWFKDEAAKHIEIAESTALTSGYTLLESGDWASWNANKDAGADSIEGVCVIRLDDGRWRVYFNENNGLNSIRTVYSETTDDWRTGTSTWTEQAVIDTDALMAHGSVIFLPGIYDHMRDPDAHPQYATLDDLDSVTPTEASIRDAGRWEVIIAGSAPPVAVTTEDETDWVYGWVSGS